MVEGVIPPFILVMPNTKNRIKIEQSKKVATKNILNLFKLEKLFIVKVAIERGLCVLASSTTRFDHQTPFFFYKCLT